MNEIMLFLPFESLYFGKMKKLGFLAVLASLVMAASSCDKIRPAENEPNPYKALELTTKSAEFARQGNAFAFEFIDRINAVEDSDFVISPLSMQFLLGMLLDGAQNATADEICSVLGYGAGDVAAVNEYCLSMLSQLPSLDKKTTLQIANAIFVNDKFPLLGSYKSAVGNYYLAEVANLDFANGDKSLKTINSWCSDKTNGMIPKVLDEVSEDMLAYLFNALYFKSQWKEKFPKAGTSDEPFTTEDGSVRKVPMMKNNETFVYQDNDDFRALSLPYGNGAFCMMVIMPQDGKTLMDVSSALKSIDWRGFLEGMISCEVDLWLPKFQTKYSKCLNELLSDMGMPSAFDAKRADFKAMSDYALCLSFVRQDAVIKVDEEGSEAAAISSAGMKLTSACPGKQIEFHADRPFLYLITESSSGAILFAGKYGGE